MERLEFKISINASPKKVWKILWEDETYRKWTSVFSESSFMKTDWKVGGKTLFLDGKGSGMVSTIIKMIPEKHISFEHLGIMIKGEEDYTSEEVKEWSGAHEKYTLTSNGKNTDVLIESDVIGKYKDFFTEVWPRALSLIKELSEERK
jgi:hypothetical protein